MQKKQYTLAVLMDVQGVFDSTTFVVIQEALKSCDIGRMLIRWIVNILKRRNMYLTYQGESVKSRFVKGCLQGGVLSPLLRCMVVDSLLLQLPAMGYTAQPYVDDLAIVIQGKYLDTIADLMQASLRVVDGGVRPNGCL